jgi:ATP-binding cassette subfamily B protein
LITIAVILFAAPRLTPGELEGVVVLNTAVQYINLLWTGTHQIFVWFISHGPRYRLTVKRLDEFYQMPELGDSVITSGTRVPLDGGNLQISNLSCALGRGRPDLRGVHFETNGKQVTIIGGIGSGKSVFCDLLLKKIQPTSGEIKFNGTNIRDLDTTFWRHECVSFCQSSPQFILGTVRDNFRLLAPHVTDAEILSMFYEIDAGDIVEKHPGILDFEIRENLDLSDWLKNTLNIVRTLLKPAKVYLFYQCFEHVKSETLVRLMTKLRREQKTAVLITLNGTICKNSDEILVLKDGAVVARGTHDELISKNAQYRALHTAAYGVIADGSVDATPLVSTPIDDEGDFSLVPGGGGESI